MQLIGLELSQPTSRGSLQGHARSAVSGEIISQHPKVGGGRVGVWISVNEGRNHIRIPGGHFWGTWHRLLSTAVVSLRPPTPLCSLLLPHFVFGTESCGNCFHARRPKQSGRR